MAKRIEKAPVVQVRVQRRAYALRAHGGPGVSVVVRKAFGRAPEEHAFILKDGRKLRTVFELIDALETMPDEIFKHHVAADRNDFAAWLDAVFDEKSLAADIRSVSSRLDAQRAILKHLVRELTKHHASCKGC